MKINNLKKFCFSIVFLAFFKWYVVYDCGLLPEGNVCGVPLYSYADVKKLIKEVGENNVIQIYYMNSLYSRNVEGLKD
jgi:hypothetical protein